ncbi:MAG TPA: glycoside hydrolase family 3 N-terminal domain-containing protein, partial [Haloplasmataceae bacterium]
MKRIEDMTLREKIGQLMMCGFPGTDVTEMIDLIKRYKIGNVILFARNVKDPKQLFELNQTLQKVALETLGQPLFISIDQEG